MATMGEKEDTMGENEEETPLIVELFYELFRYTDVKSVFMSKRKAHLVAALVTNASTVEGFKKEHEEAVKLGLERQFFEVISGNLKVRRPFELIAGKLKAREPLERGFNYEELMEGEGLEAAFKRGENLDDLRHLVTSNIKVPYGGPFDGYYSERTSKLKRHQVKDLGDIPGCVPLDVCFHVEDLRSKYKRRNRHLKPDEEIFPDMKSLRSVPVQIPPVDLSITIDGKGFGDFVV